jgi:UDP-N-acetylmuramyl pentapeptide phosphotransferase/UDP-N-acetylglucosamine-1-phosphate transferase
MDYLPAIFSLLVAAAGWYYMFYSQAAQKLHGIEGERENRLRVRLRRIGGLVIMLLAVSFYTMIVLLERERFAAAGTVIVLVMVLMGAVLALGLADLRLTRRMRRKRDGRR